MAVIPCVMRLDSIEPWCPLGRPRSSSPPGSRKGILNQYTVRSFYNNIVVTAERSEELGVLACDWEKRGSPVGALGSCTISFGLDAAVAQVKDAFNKARGNGSHHFDNVPI